MLLHKAASCGPSCCVASSYMTPGRKEKSQRSGGRERRDGRPVSLTPEAVHQVCLYHTKALSAKHFASLLIAHAQSSCNRLTLQAHAPVEHMRHVRTYSSSCSTSQSEGKSQTYELNFREATDMQINSRRRSRYCLTSRSEHGCAAYAGWTDPPVRASAYRICSQAM